MHETKPLLILYKYRSIMTSALIVEFVSFLVSLTDAVVASNIVGMDAFAAYRFLHGQKEGNHVQNIRDAVRPIDTVNGDRHG